MEKFKSFITEAKKEKYKVVVLTRKPDDYPNHKSLLTSAKFEKSAKALELDFYMCFINGAYLSFENELRRIHNADDDKGFEISTDDTLIIVRGGVNARDSWKDLLSQLERAGYTCVNSRECMEVCSDKYRTSLRLAEVGLSTPTTVLIPDEDSAEIAFEKLNTTYPVILKTISGTKGVGVLFVESEKSLESMVQLLYKVDEEISLILQTYIKTDYDVRVMVLNNIIVGAMQRNVVSGDFRSNVHLGSSIKKYELTEKEKRDCISAAKAVNGVWVGVDFIPAKDRENDSPFILEVNSSPGTEGFDKSTKKNITKHFLENFMDKENWWKTSVLAGVWETFEHEKLGSIIGKMDTGNSSKTSVIHSDTYEIKGKKINWELNGVKMISKIEEMKKINLGGFRDRTEVRPSILLDFTFAGTLYKNMRFTIDDRGKKTPILINRNFMNKANISIDPSRKFILTERLDNLHDE